MIPSNKTSGSREVQSWFFLTAFWSIGFCYPVCRPSFSGLSPHYHKMATMAPGITFSP